MNRGALAILASVACWLLPSGCAESRRALGEECLKDQDCLSGVCSELQCAGSGPLFDGSTAAAPPDASSEDAPLPDALDDAFGGFDALSEASNPSDAGAPEASAVPDASSVDAAGSTGLEASSEAAAGLDATSGADEGGPADAVATADAE